MTRQEYNAISNSKEVKDARDKEKMECPDCKKDVWLWSTSPYSYVHTECYFHREGNYESPAAKLTDENGRPKLSLR